MMIKFKDYFEDETGRKYNGDPHTFISDHMRLIADTFAEYVNEVVQAELEKLAAHPIYIVNPGPLDRSKYAVHTEHAPDS